MSGTRDTPAPSGARISTGLILVTADVTDTGPAAVAPATAARSATEPEGLLR